MSSEELREEDAIGETEDSKSQIVENGSFVKKVLKSQQAILVCYNGVE